MKKITISHSIYFISRLAFVVCLLFSVFIILFSILAFAESNLNINIPFVGVETGVDSLSYTRIDIPITDLHVAYQNSFAIVLMWLAFAFYTFYFLTLSKFFKIFTEEEVFTASSVKILKRFMVLNLIPVCAGVGYILVTYIGTHNFRMDSEYLLLIVHSFVALLVYLYLDLLKKGKLVKDENDLTI